MARRWRATGVGVGVFSLLLATGQVATANPTLIQGTWVEITPSQTTTGAPETCIGQGIAIDPNDPDIIFWGNTPYTDSEGGLFKTTNAGESWTRVGSVTPAWQGASDHLDMPLHIRIDPNDSNHMYAGDGVRGSSTGFFISTDGGATFAIPQGFIDARNNAMPDPIDNQDIYDVAVNPCNFNHVLISYHYRWGWTETVWNQNSGILESTDGGETWIVHNPQSGWGSGHAIKFLSSPALEIGDYSTWLLGTQGGGYWRTSDSGGSWTKVSDTNITHGGGSAYYASTGTLYVSGAEASMRSTDNGETWESVGPNGTWGMYGDGTTLYTGKSFGANQPYSVSPETDGDTWSNFNGQNFPDGPYEMAYDSMNGIMYSSNWSSGVWALKVGAGTGELPEKFETCAVTGGPSGTGGSGSGGSDASGGSGGSGGSGTAGTASAGTSNASGGSGTAGTSASGGATTGTGGATAGTSSSGGAGTAGSMGVGPGNDTPSDDPGCACRSTGRGSKSAASWLSLLVLGLVAARRRNTGTAAYKA